MNSKFWRRVIKYGILIIEAISSILEGLGKDKDEPKQLNK